jgi:hypothetical protein
MRSISTIGTLLFRKRSDLLSKRDPAIMLTRPGLKAHASGKSWSPAVAEDEHGRPHLATVRLCTPFASA